MGVVGAVCVSGCVHEFCLLSAGVKILKRGLLEYLIGCWFRDVSAGLRFGCTPCLLVQFWKEKSIWLHQVIPVGGIWRGKFFLSCWGILVKVVLFFLHRLFWQFLILTFYILSFLVWSCQPRRRFYRRCVYSVSSTLLPPFHTCVCRVSTVLCFFLPSFLRSITFDDHDPASCCQTLSLFIISKFLASFNTLVYKGRRKRTSFRGGEMIYVKVYKNSIKKDLYNRLQS